MYELNEIWKDVVGYNGKYSVSNFGKVRSNFSISKYGKIKELGTILKTHINRRGYEIIKLYNGEQKTAKVHRLVCIAFHPNPENKPQVNHKDLNQLNNRADNLEWCTAKENTNHAQLNGRMPMGRKIYIKKGRPLGVKKVINIETREIFNSVNELSAIIGIKPKEIHRRLNGERYNKTPYRYVGKENLVKPIPQIVIPKSPIAVFDMDWGLIKEFDYKKDAINYVKCTISDVNDFMKGRRSHVKGYKFKFIDKFGDYINPIPFVSKKPPLKPKKIKQPVTPAKPIIKYDLKGNEVERFSSIGKISTNKSYLREVIKTGTGYYKGFIYKYA